MLLCLLDPSSPKQRATRFQFHCWQPIPETFSHHYYCTWLYPINLHLSWMKCLKRILTLQLKHEQKISFSVLHKTPVPIKISTNFTAKNVMLLQNKWNKWLALNLWGTMKSLCRTVTHTVISPISAANYNYLLLGLCTCLKEKWNQFT